MWRQVGMVTRSCDEFSIDHQRICDVMHNKHLLCLKCNSNKLSDHLHEEVTCKTAYVHINMFLLDM